MEDWKTAMLALATGIGGAGAIKLFDLFTKRGADVVKTGLRERSRRIIKDIELTGDAQKDIATIAQQMIREQRSAQDEIVALSGQIASLETANSALRESFDRMKRERDTALTENALFVKQVTELLAQAKDLSMKLAESTKDYALLSIEHEGAKERIAKQEHMIREMQGWIAEAQQREAELEAEIERRRA